MFQKSTSKHKVKILLKQCTGYVGGGGRRHLMRNSILGANGICQTLGVAGILPEQPGISDIAPAQSGHRQSCQQAPGRPELGKRPRAKTHSAKWQACAIPTPRFGLNQRAIRAPPFQVRPLGCPLRLKHNNLPGFWSKQACVWNHNILGSDFTHITFLVLHKKGIRRMKVKGLEEWGILFPV